MSGASKHIKRAFDAGPIAAILLATLVGAFSPFCSCGVIPVIAALLNGIQIQPSVTHTEVKTQEFCDTDKYNFLSDN